MMLKLGRWLRVAGCGLAAAMSSAAALAGTAGAGVQIDVQLTLDTAAAPACGTQPAIEVVAGTPVNHCFTITNLGSETLRWHSIGSDIFSEFDQRFRNLIELPIAPGATAQYNLTLIAGSSSDATFHWTAFPETPSYTIDTAAPFDSVDLSAIGNPQFENPIPLPFDFRLYGRSFPAGAIDRLCVYDNGAVQWVPHDSYCGGEFALFGGDHWNPPPPDGNDAMLPYWEAFGSAGSVAYAVIGSAPDRRAVLEWRNKGTEVDELLGIPCAAADPADCGITFQLLIDEADGAISFSYLDVNFDAQGGDLYLQDAGGSAMIGLIDTTRNLRQIVSVEQQTLQAGQTIRFTPMHASAIAFSQVRLVAGSPKLRIDPAAVAMQALVGEPAASQPIAVRNLGDIDLSWSLSERAPKWHFPPPQAAKIPLQPTPGVLPARALGAGTADEVPAYAILRNGLDGAPYRRVNAAAPSQAALVRQLGHDSYGGDFINDDLSRHLMLMDTNRQGNSYDWGFADIDTATGEITVRGEAPIEGGDGFWRGMAWDRSNGTLYAVASTCYDFPGRNATLYRIDPATAASTRIARLDTGGTDLCVSDIAVSPDGAMYAVDVLTSSLLAIDKATGETQAIGPLGFRIADADRPQLDFDDQTGVLYFAGTNDDIPVVKVGVYTLETSTGAASYVGPFNYNTGSYMTPVGFAIARPGPECIDPDAVPWLQIGNTSDTTAPAGESIVSLTLDPGGLAPGDYHAELCFTSNDRSAPLRRVPVDLRVAEPAILRDGFEGADL